MKYEISIDISTAQINGPAWRDYGLLTASGNSLEQLKRNATVQICDFDNQPLYTEPATAEWMQDLVEREFMLKYGRKNGSGSGSALNSFCLVLLAGL